MFTSVHREFLLFVDIVGEDFRRTAFRTRLQFSSFSSFQSEVYLQEFFCFFLRKYLLVSMLVNLGVLPNFKMCLRINVGFYG